MGAPPDERRGAFRRCTGVPMLSCAVVLLLPLPAAASGIAPGAGARTVPRATASSDVEAEAFGTPGWETRFAQRLADSLGDRPFGTHGGTGGHGPDLPLPPLFGPHGHPGDVEAGAQADRPGPALGGSGPSTEDDESGESEEPGARPEEAAPSDARLQARAQARAEGYTAAQEQTEPRQQPPPGGTADQHGAWSPAPVAPDDKVAGTDGGSDARADGPHRAQDASPQQRPPADEPVSGVPAAAGAPAGPVLPVLPLGAGLASLGLGLAFLALRLRRN
jgi:hypothetical protein